MANLIVLRQSPDWRSFDIEATRLFCAKLDLPEDMIVEFAEIWDSQMALSFLEYRQAIKEIAMDGVRDCKDAVIIDYKTFEDSKPKDGDTIYFTDDDDWVSPNIFGAINSHGVKDLLVWGSVYVGQMYFNTPQAKMEDPVVALRPLRSDIVYTNNYALASSTVRRLGLKAVLAHEDAQVALNAGRVKANALDLYLTAANKHPLLCDGDPLQHEIAVVSSAHEGVAGRSYS